MSEANKIQNGPFKGIGPLAHEIRPLLNTNGLPVMNREGKVIDIWGVHHKTPHVLDVYKPTDGWGIVISDRPGPFEIPDPNTLVTNGSGQQVAASQPTTIFVAELTNPEGRVMANASVLCIINSTFSWSDGQTLARSKLYVAMGLTAPNDQSDVPPASTGAPTDKTTAPVAGVTAVDAPFKHDKLPAAAQALIEQSAQSSAPVSESPEPTQVAKDASPTTETKAPTLTVVPSANDASQVSANHANPQLNKNLLRQAEHRARVAGKDVPTFANDDEIRVFCKDLLKKAG